MRLSTVLVLTLAAFAAAALCLARALLLEREPSSQSIPAISALSVQSSLRKVDESSIPRTQLTESDAGANYPEVHIVVICSPVDPQERAARSSAIRDTWGLGGMHCSGGACIKLAAATFLDVPQPEVEDTGQWLRAFLAEHEAHPDLAWLMKVEDTAELLPRQLARFVSSYDPLEPLLLGSQLRTAWPPHHEYVSGAGFVVSAAALRLVRNAGGLDLIPRGMEKIPDVGFSAVCTKVGARMPDTRDSDGGERFNVFPPHVCARGAYHDWFQQYKREAGQPALGGAACCAADSVLFQYVGPAEQRALPLLLAPGAPQPLPGWRWPRPALFDRWDRLLGDDRSAERDLLLKLRSGNNMGPP